MNKYLSNYLEVSEKAIEGYFFNSKLFKKQNYPLFDNFFMEIIVFLFFPFFLLFKLLKRNPKILKFQKVGIEEWRSDSYDLYYYELNAKRISINKNLKREVNIFDFTDKQSLLKILKLYFNPKFIFLVLKEKNFFEVVKLLYAYHYFNIIAKYSNVKIYISAHDLMAHLLKYEILKKYNIKYFLIQSSIRQKNYILYKGGDVLYCYGKQQGDFYRDDTNNFQKIREIGSIKNDKYLHQKVDVKYDVIFIEHFLDAKNVPFYRNEDYIKVLENFIKFSEEFPNLNLLYQSRIEKRKTKSHIRVFDEIFDRLDKSNIEVSYYSNSYEKVMESKTVIGVFSTLCFEAIGLNKPSLFYYYYDYDFDFFDLKNSKDDIVIINDSYEIFRDKILYYLNNPEKYDFKKYKKIYMNQVDDFFKEIQKDINENNNI